MNAQLQAQLRSDGSRSIAAAPGHPAGASEPFLVRSHKRGCFLVEGSLRREIKAGVLFAALAWAIGPVREVRDSQLDTWNEGPPVEVLLAPHGPAFVVIGGRRHSIRGLPRPYQVATEEMLRFPVGPELLISVPPPTRGARLRRVLRREGFWRASAITARRAIGRLRRMLASAGLRAGTRARSRGGSGCRARPVRELGLNVRASVTASRCQRDPVPTGALVQADRVGVVVGRDQPQALPPVRARA